MTFNHDDIDDSDDEARDSLPDEANSDDADVAEPEPEPGNAFSQALREVMAVPIEDAEEEEDSDEAADGDDAEPYEPHSDTLLEEEGETVRPPLELSPLDVEPFRPQEQDNYAYADAVTAYYVDKNYPRAIEKFGEAIENEARGTEGTETEVDDIVVKSMYWQAEAYVKLQDIPQAVLTFKSLVETCKGHYLALAAQRRVDSLQ